MEWFKQHADTIVILSSFALCFWNLNEKMNDKFCQLEKEMAVMRTVLIMKNVMPSDMACKEVDKK